LTKICNKKSKKFVLINEKTGHSGARLFQAKTIGSLVVVVMILGLLEPKKE